MQSALIHSSHTLAPANLATSELALFLTRKEILWWNDVFTEISIQDHFISISLQDRVEDDSTLDAGCKVDPDKASCPVNYSDLAAQVKDHIKSIIEAEKETSSDKRDGKALKYVKKYGKILNAVAK